MLPANPGGGWDATGRQAFQAMNEAGIYTDGVNFTNKGGAGGTIGLAEFQGGQRGKPDALAVFGAITVGSIILNQSPINLTDFRPVARLTAEYLVIAVSADSPHQSLQDLVAALKADPGATAVGGGSAGGVDHIALALLAQAADIPVADVNYIPQASGAETVTGIVNGTLAAGISGISEFAQFAEQGRIRILGITSADRKEGLDVPTFKEAGYDIEIANWRGILGAPGMPDDNYQLWVDRFTQLNESDAWKKVLETQGWDQFFLAGEEFGAFIAEENERIATVLKEAGLAQ
ncbi:tripartite tricarboxylate transporter substrate-binding protein [Chelativorans sp.]|uniref:Bug family tripartite tricarboxylate transporter substrate binding protein n=1 Tax=Chelativorans sp. TaxID=2203393 RepID=UPI0028126917|nr:tripartite tricarboxylate transporter substrate-binding protein [Chelativorans sp.]